MSICSKNVICLLIITLLQACSGVGVAPVANRGEVKKAAPTTSQRGTVINQNQHQKLNQPYKINRVTIKLVKVTPYTQSPGAIIMIIKR